MKTRNLVIGLVAAIVAFLLLGLFSSASASQDTNDVGVSAEQQSVATDPIVYPPMQPADALGYTADGQVHPLIHGGAIWFDPAGLTQSYYYTITNGLPWWQYVIHTRLDGPTSVQAHYGHCQTGYSCVRLFDGNYGDQLELGGVTLAWTDPNWFNKISSSVNVDYNMPSMYEGSRRAHIFVHELGHAVGLGYHRSTSDSSSAMCVYPCLANTFNAADLRYINDSY